MTQNSRPNPARAIVDLAQSALPFEEIVQGILGVLDETLGVDTALAIRSEFGAELIDRNAADDLRASAVRTLRYAKTRYADDLLPVFARTDRVGACLDTEFYGTERTKAESIYYKEILEPAGVRSMLQLCARWQGRPLLRINLNRHGLGRFGPGDLEKALELLPTIEASLVACLHTGARQEIPGLTPRELEIAQLVARGLTSAQIGLVLGTSQYTVRNQLSRIFDKLNLDSRAELAALVGRG